VHYSAGQNGLAYSAVHLPLTKVALVSQGGISARHQARKLSWKEAFNVMTCLGHVTTELGFDEP